MKGIMTEAIKEPTTKKIPKELPKEFISKVSKKGAGDRCIIVPRKELEHFKPGDHVMVRIMYKRGDNV